MIGHPPQEFLDKELYERPYVYVKTSIGTHENWLPLVGVQDHAANIYNSFIFASIAAENLGYKRIFRIEADTEFNLNDLLLVSFYKRTKTKTNVCTNLPAFIIIIIIFLIRIAGN